MMSFGSYKFNSNKLNIELRLWGLEIVDSLRYVSRVIKRLNKAQNWINWPNEFENLSKENVINFFIAYFPKIALYAFRKAFSQIRSSKPSNLILASSWLTTLCLTNSDPFSTAWLILQNNFNLLTSVRLWMFWMTFSKFFVGMRSFSLSAPLKHSNKLIKKWFS